MNVATNLAIHKYVDLNTHKKVKNKIMCSNALKNSKFCMGNRFSFFRIFSSLLIKKLEINLSTSKAMVKMGCNNNFGFKTHLCCCNVIFYQHNSKIAATYSFFFKKKLNENNIHTLLLPNVIEICAYDWYEYVIETGKNHEIVKSERAKERKGRE